MKPTLVVTNIKPTRPLEISREGHREGHRETLYPHVVRKTIYPYVVRKTLRLAFMRVFMQTFVQVFKEVTHLQVEFRKTTHPQVRKEYFMDTLVAHL